MKTSVFFWALATATLSIAQSVSDLPSCSLSCFQAAVATTSCGPTDTACQCTTGKVAITNAVIPCLSKASCSVSDLQTIEKVNAALCAKALSIASTSSATGASSTESTVSPKVPSPQSASSALSSSAAPAATSASVNTFGANTPGTEWRTAAEDNRHQNRGPIFEAVAISMFAIACFFVIFRFYARVRTRRQRKVVRGLWVDEYLALAASIFTAGVFGCLVVGVDNGMGKHLASTTPKELIATIKITYAFTIISILCLVCLKLSVLCLYLRMTPESTHKRTIWTIMAIIGAHGIVATLGTIFQCTPIHSYWAISGPAFEKRKCTNPIDFNIFNNSFGAFEDIVIWILPIPVVAKLQVPTPKKSGLYFLIAVSGISVICSCLRLSSMIMWIHADDISWNFPLIPLFITLEACVALITSSVPAIYPLFRKPRPNSYPSTPNFRRPPFNGFRSQDSTIESRQRPRNTFLARLASMKIAWPSTARSGNVGANALPAELHNMPANKGSITDSAVSNESIVKEEKGSTFWIQRKSDG